MYEKPELHEIGPAGEVILGIDSLGTDLDTTRMIPDIEWAEDAE